MSDANREAFAPKCTCEHAHDFECPQHGTGAWQRAFNEGLEAAATKCDALQIEGGVSNKHFAAGWEIGTLDCAKEIRAMKLPEQSEQEKV